MRLYGGVCTHIKEMECSMKNLKKTFALALSLLMVFSMMGTAFAAEVDVAHGATPYVATDPNDGIMPLFEGGRWVQNSWVMMRDPNLPLVNLGGRTVAFKIKNFQGLLYQLDVRFDDRYGNEISTQWNVTEAGDSGVIQCPANTYFVQCKIAPRTFFTSEASFWVTAVYEHRA